MKKILLILAMAFVLLGSNVNALSPGEYNISFIGGYITDTSTGDAIGGADITVLCIDNGETNSGTSQSTGFYLISVPCSVGNTIKVTATSGTESGISTGIIEYFGSVILGITKVNIGIAKIDVGIPEFPVVALPALLAMLSFGIARRFV